MRREHHFARNASGGFFKVHALFLHPISNGFKYGKRAMAFIEVKNAWRDPHRLQCTETSHAQNQFLPDPNAAIASIKPRCQIAIFRRIASDVGIQKQQIAAANLKPPDSARCRPLQVSI